MDSIKLKKPSKFHINRSSKNWLIYDNADNLLLKYSPLYKGVLYDLGCGDSPYETFFLQFADQYVGVDWGKSGNPTKETIEADLNMQIPVNSGIADTVVSLSVMEHLYAPQQLLNESFRILKSGGYIIFQVPWQWWIHDAPHDYFRYTPFALRYMLEQTGFSDIEIEPQNGFFTMWVLKFNYFTSRFIFGPKAFQWLISICLLPFWYFGQLLAPVLDEVLDRDWTLETTGYYIVAKKP